MGGVFSFYFSVVTWLALGKFIYLIFYIPTYIPKNRLYTYYRAVQLKVRIYINANFSLHDPVYILRRLWALPKYKMYLRIEKCRIYTLCIHLVTQRYRVRHPNCTPSTTNLSSIGRCSLGAAPCISSEMQWYRPCMYDITKKFRPPVCILALVPAQQILLRTGKKNHKNIFNWSNQ